MAPTFDYHKTPTAKLLLSKADIRRSRRPSQSPSLWHFSRDQNSGDTRVQPPNADISGSILRNRKNAHNVFRHALSQRWKFDPLFPAQQREVLCNLGTCSVRREKSCTPALVSSKKRVHRRRDSIFTLSRHTPQGAARMTCKTALARHCQNHPASRIFF